MTGLSEIILACILGIDLFLAASSRLLSTIRWVALQGLLLGLLIMTTWNWQQGIPHGHTVALAAGNIILKCALLPWLLALVMRRTNVKRELEPFVGYSASIAVIVLAGAVIFWFCGSLSHLSRLAVPVAFITMFTGLFIIIARRKAITQVTGFLVFENGISLFGGAMMLDQGLLVELGIMLDVLVLVFIMGIALFQISREFQHIDSDRLNQLDDNNRPDDPDISVEVEQ